MVILRLKPLVFQSLRSREPSLRVDDQQLLHEVLAHLGETKRTAKPSV